MCDIYMLEVNPKFKVNPEVLETSFRQPEIK